MHRPPSSTLGSIRCLTFAVIAAAVVATVPATVTARGAHPAAGPSFRGDATWHDFNGDGFGDLAISAAGDTVTGHPDAGSVQVLYGSATGLTSARNQLWSQDSPGVLDTAEKDDSFGQTLAAGDFDGDGFGDLAIGVPGEDRGGFTDRGAVAVLFGSPTGLSAARDQLLVFSSTSTCFKGSQDGWRWGSALAVADIGPLGEYFRSTPDGRADLVVGFRGADGCAGDAPASGGYEFLWGTASGLATAGSGTVRTCVPEKPSNSGCGTVLAWGDLDGDGEPDLVMGLPGYDIDDPDHPATSTDHDVHDTLGLVAISFGNGSPDHLWSKPAFRFSTKRFGAAVAVGDLDRDGDDDLVVGAPGAIDSGKDNAGAIVLVSGSPSQATVIDQGKEVPIGQSSFGGILGTPAVADQLGASLAIGNLGDGPELDLAIGAPGEQAGTATRAGAVLVAYGGTAAGKTSLDLAGHQTWSQATTGVLGTPRTGEDFGHALAIEDLGRNGAGELIVGVPFDDVGTVELAGVAQVLYGTATGVTATNDQLWHRDQPGIVGVAGTEDHFGLSFP